MKFEDPTTGELIENRGWVERLTDEPEVNIVVLLMKCRLQFLLRFCSLNRGFYILLKSERRKRNERNQR